MVKNPNWQEANQLVTLQATQRIQTRDYREQIQLVVRAGLEREASELQVQRSNHSTTLPLLKGNQFTFFSETIMLLLYLSKF